MTLRVRWMCSGVVWLQSHILNLHGLPIPFKGRPAKNQKEKKMDQVACSWLLRFEEDGEFGASIFSAGVWPGWAGAALEGDAWDFRGEWKG